MGNIINKYFYKPVKCAYCYSEVSNRTTVCYIYSKGKLNGLYVCNLCLLNKSRRYDYLALRTYNNNFNKL